MSKGRMCKLWWCDEKHYSNGYCNPHYQLDRRTGTVLPENRRDVIAIMNKAEELARLMDELLEEVDTYEHAELVGRCEDALQGILPKYDKPVSLI